MDVPLIVLDQYKKLSDDAKTSFGRLYADRKKKKGLAIFLAIIGVHYIYLGRWGAFFGYLLTGGGVLIWWLIDLFRVSGMIDRVNEDTAMKLIHQLK